MKLKSWCPWASIGAVAAAVLVTGCTGLNHSADLSPAAALRAARPQPPLKATA